MFPSVSLHRTNTPTVGMSILSPSTSPPADLHVLDGQVDVVDADHAREGVDLLGALARGVNAAVDAAWLLRITRGDHEYSPMSSPICSICQPNAFV